MIFEALKAALEELRPSGFHHLNNDFHGSLPLFRAASSGPVRNAQLLIEHGAAKRFVRHKLLFQRWSQRR